MSNSEALEPILEDWTEEGAPAGGQPDVPEFDQPMFRILYLIQKSAPVQGLLVRKGNIASSPEERIADIAEMPTEEVGFVLKGCADYWFARENLAVGLNNKGSSWLKSMRRSRSEETAALQAGIDDRLATEVKRDTVRRMCSEVNRMQEELYRYRLVQKNPDVSFYRVIDDGDEEAIERMRSALRESEIDIEAIDSMDPDLFEEATVGLEKTITGLELSITRITRELCRRRHAGARSSQAAGAARMVVNELYPSALPAVPTWPDSAF